MLRPHALYQPSERQTYSLEVGDADTALPTVEVSSHNFVCFIAWDSREAPVAHVAQVVDRLLDSGASYFVCWGPGCERVHDIIDESLVERDPKGSGPLVITTWHDDESLEEALWFAIFVAYPADEFEDSTQALVAISVQSPSWRNEISLALSDLDALNERVVED